MNIHYQLIIPHTIGLGLHLDFGIRPPTNWEKKFIELAAHISTWSKHTTQVGSILVNPKNNSVVCVAYNGVARGVEDHESRYKTDLKLLYHAHSECNLVANAGLNGINTDGKHVYLSALPCCSQCANLLVNAGIERIVAPKISMDDPKIAKWKDSIEAAKQIFLEAGKTVDYYL